VETHEIRASLKEASELIERLSCALSQQPPPTEFNRLLIQSAADFLEKHGQQSPLFR
jgi:hypothetical protein